MKDDEIKEQPVRVPFANDPSLMFLPGIGFWRLQMLVHLVETGPATEHELLRFCTARWHDGKTIIQGMWDARLVEMDGEERTGAPVYQITPEGVAKAEELQAYLKVYCKDVLPALTNSLLEVPISLVHSFNACLRSSEDGPEEEQLEA